MARADRLHARIGRSTRELFAVLVRIGHTEAWREDGARDLSHWVQMRYGISAWKAERFIDAASALERLPRTSRALESGRLGVDKVVELTRFASPATESALLTWAESVSTGSIRRRADLETRRPPEASSDLDHERRCRWWLTDQGRRMELMAELPATDGALVAAAIERAATGLPELPGESRTETLEARRADALVALCTEGAPAPAGRRPTDKGEPGVKRGGPGRSARGSWCTLPLPRSCPIVRSRRRPSSWQKGRRGSRAGCSTSPPLPDWHATQSSRCCSKIRAENR